MDLFCLGPPVHSVKHNSHKVISNLDIFVICPAPVSSPYTLEGGGVAPEIPTLHSDLKFLHKNNLMAVWTKLFFIHVPLDN